MYCTKIFRYVFLNKEIAFCCKINIAYVLISFVCLSLVLAILDYNLGY